MKTSRFRRRVGLLRSTPAQLAPFRSAVVKAHFEYTRAEEAYDLNNQRPDFRMPRSAEEYGERRERRDIAARALKEAATRLEIARYIYIDKGFIDPVELENTVLQALRGQRRPAPSHSS